MGLSPDQIKLYQWLLASMLALSAVDRGLSPDQIIPKTIELVFATSALSLHH